MREATDDTAGRQRIEDQVASTDKVGANGEELALRIDERAYGMEQLHLATDIHIFNINLYSGAQSRANVLNYYLLCRDFPDLHVTTSCFTVWRQNKKTNGFAKLIPAITPGFCSEGKPRVRVFFFDDNLEWEGREGSQGICNLRDITTGDFVEFTEGKNGFCREKAGRHTAIHYSSEYRVVLVKANILDAMEDPEYFADIIRRFAEPDEKLLVFMDVNSTIVCHDTIQGKNIVGTLLSTMFEFVELRPSSPFEIEWDGLPVLKVEKKKTFKQLVKEMTVKRHDVYSGFWTEATCSRFFAEMASKGEVRWIGQEHRMDLAAFQQLFQEYLVALQRVTTKDGIAISWFRVFEGLKGKHTVVLNSFGVDTRKVILATVPDERRVLQVTVNHELWDPPDVTQFEGQFRTL